MSDALAVSEPAGHCRLEIERNSCGDLLRVAALDGKAIVTIEISSAGAVVRLHGPGASLSLDGDLAIEAERVAIHGRQGLSLTTGGEAKILAAGDLESRARIQNITAELGNVNILANDDVKLNGERVLMNC